MNSTKRNARRNALVAAALCFVYLVVAGAQQRRAQRSAGNVEQRRPLPTRAACPLNDTLMREQWKQCEYSVRHRHVLLHGRDVVMVAADSPDYERINIALFDVGGMPSSTNARRSERSCERIDIPTFLFPAKRFVPHAVRMCESVLEPNGSSREISLDTTENFLGAAPSKVTPRVVVPKDPRVGHVFVVVYAASNYSGHSLELLLDSVGGAIATLSREAHSRVDIGARALTFVLHDYEEAQHTFAARYAALLEEALASRLDATLPMSFLTVQFEKVALYSPVLFRLRPVDSLVYVAPMFDETPCQQVAQRAWCTLCANTGGAPIPVLVILKRDRKLQHHTPNFFTVNDEEVLSRTMNIRFLSESVSKKVRLVHLNQAHTLVDSFGANAHINRLLLLPASLVLQRWITLIHPNASERIREAYCNVTVTRTNGVRREFRCIETSHVSLGWFREHL